MWQNYDRIETLNTQRCAKRLGRVECVPTTSQKEQVAIRKMAVGWAKKNSNQFAMCLSLLYALCYVRISGMHISSTVHKQ